MRRFAPLWHVQDTPFPVANALPDLPSPGRTMIRHGMTTGYRGADEQGPDQWAGGALYSVVGASNTNCAKRLDFSSSSYNLEDGLARLGTNEVRRSGRLW
ncbi:unnamed protein product [Protopolystoma xenopodis]|uniref:Uncharacterized protein n=1 Tax=Protopolystoma xenopodis TaxID=117903 RepID=A0A3S5AAS9_9PLAT|nr:unnamed protein product [Protopolystoma xenopodis]